MHYRVHLALDYAHDIGARTEMEKAIKAPFTALPAVSPDDWHQLERKHLQQRWSDRQIEQADIVIVLAGRLTYSRPLIRREISQAAKLQKPMFGLYIDPKFTSVTCPNPFSYVMAGNTGFRYQIHALPTTDVDAYIRQCIEEVMPHPPERRAPSSSGSTVLI